ncbi:MAG: hypothetical protein K2H68_01535 [Bacteroidales bacterium]|nr:hypothetical protein [Bacteroidales bacterium]
MDITKKQYEYALSRVEELLPVVQDTTPANDRYALELSIVADMVRDYEMQYHPIEKPDIEPAAMLGL